MKVFTKIADLQIYLQAQKAQGKHIGFVPTMGALHKGHLSLIQKAKVSSTLTVCSIFVNPTQFNDKKDFSHYPRTLEVDAKLLTAQHCDVLFIPTVEEIYPTDQIIPVPDNFGYLTEPMEGKHRPGHFQGMVQVVKRLLDIVQPDLLFMGQKDFQQLAIVQRLLEITKLPVQLVGCPIVREKDGLAMSSRNRLLPSQARKEAIVLYQTLQQAQQHFSQQQSITYIKAHAVQQLLNTQGLGLDYFEIVDATTLVALETSQYSAKAIACVAAKIGGIRLIDNMFMN